MTDLRERQKALARESITDAAATLITERHQLDFSMQEVADRAGVSLRTVYNHFETREDLLDELGREYSRRMADAGGADADDTDTLAQLLAAVRTNVGLFEELGGVSEALAQMPLAEVGRDPTRARRTRKLVDVLVAEMGDIPETEAREIALVIRHLFSHRSWFWLTREYGIEPDRLADTTTWVITTLIDATRRGDHPRKEHP
jgi:AcrR family transcriptional regulator